MMTATLRTEATDKRRGMTLEEIQAAIKRFENHLCMEPAVHLITVRIGWHNQITSMTMTCVEEIDE